MPLAAGAGAAAAATAVAAFDYNRENFFHDSGMRFQRYTTGYAFAIEQAKQYREDIRNFTEIAVAKGEIFSMLGVVFCVLNIQLIMAGRLGVHGPAPPMWLLGIYWANSTGAMMFLVVYIWLSMHASARAQAGGAHMLTRNVRLPIPSPKQLDKARRTGNSFEKQRVTDVFRVPFVAPAPKEKVYDMEKGSSSADKAAAGPVSNRRMPKWYEDEQKELNPNATCNIDLGPNANPEHFELYRGVQQEWWCHEAYARIGLLYFFSAWWTSLSLYSQSFIFTELRAMWPAWSVTPIFCVAHWAMLKIDILPEKMTRLSFLHLEDIVPFAPLLSLVAMQLEYSVYPKHAMGIMRCIVYIFAYTLYAIFLAWSIRLYDLAEPRLQAEKPEVAGQCWWPQDWWVPPAFNGTVYVIAAPAQLVPSVANCLQIEMKASKALKSSAPQNIKKQRVAGPQLWPWKIFRGAVITYIAVMFFTTLGMFAEHTHGGGMVGDGYFLKQAGRTVRWPAHIQPWMSPWIREGHRDQMAHAGGSDRRLSQATPEYDAARVAHSLANLVGPMVDAMEGKRQHATQASQLPSPLRANIVWPDNLMPSILASRSANKIAALEPSRRGALIDLSPEGIHAVTESFVLSGIEHLGELLGASWGASGLVLTSTGGVAECSGMPLSGVWPCAQVAPALPLGGSSIVAASAARSPGGMRAAVAFAEGSVVVFDARHGEWMATGEVQLPVSDGFAEPHLSMADAGDQLLISSRRGSVLTWRMSDPEPGLAAPAHSSGEMWWSACSLGGHRVAHLATSLAAAAPKLIISSNM